MLCFGRGLMSGRSSTACAIFFFVFSWVKAKSDSFFFTEFARKKEEEEQHLYSEISMM
uniref:Uncharacterized protein n=1 Tax=Nelumbo nucifera TaxID=4432 RepID=A0A822XYU6_NELNU|nr:TPA_asm: hypothetical protein HUJ06_026357 [Nelumbo nucifera]